MKIAEEELQTALLAFFNDGATPLDVVGVISDAWELHLYDRRELGGREVSALLDAKRFGPR